jgi:hypothetical protein
MDDFMLTTVDNPYNPFDQFENWLMFDKEKGYDTCERLMRVADQYLFEGMSQQEYDAAVDRAMMDLIDIDILNVFVRGTRDSIQAMIDQRNKSNSKVTETEEDNNR